MLIKYLTRIKILNLNRYVHTQNKKSLNFIPSFKNATNFPDKIALYDTNHRYTYTNIFLNAKELAEEISNKMNGKLNERVLFMCPNNVNYLVTLWAIWMSGQIAVPLSPLHPQNLLLYYTNDVKPKIAITTPEFKEKLYSVSKNTHTQLMVINNDVTPNKSSNTETLNGGLNDEFYQKNDALILFTSGTTGSPKGVVLSHKNLYSQVNMLVDSWKWSSKDVILHTLPLNHVHGIVNALLSPLTVGAKIVMLPKFDANTVWNYLLGMPGKTDDHKINLYMAVPTIYSQLIDEYERVFGNDDKMKEYVKNTLKTKIRLMVSGSAPLPEPLFDKWFKLSGHKLLERYGMTEIGMCLSNPYDLERIPGYVGNPLPGVSIKIGKKINDKEYVPIVESSNINGQLDVKVIDETKEENLSGHLLVKSDGVFKEYFNRPEATIKEFTVDDYFITGDICQFDENKKAFKILGRNSVDIIKSGGYKLSALEIETQLLSNENIKECVVVGLPDEKWGEKVVAIVVLHKDKTMILNDLKQWALNKLPKYAIPSVLTIVDNIPRNLMGKINKKELINNLFDKK